MANTNSSRYTVAEITSAFTKHQLAIALAASTDWDETVRQQYVQFESKEQMVEYLFEWLDTVEDTPIEDIFVFIRKSNESI